MGGNESQRRERPAADPPSTGPRNDDPRARWLALSAMLEALDGVEALGGAARLRELAERAHQVIAVVEEVQAQSWALGGLYDIGDALDELTCLEPKVCSVARLHDVADDLDELASAMRDVRRHRDELEEAVDDAWEAAGGPT